MDNSRLYKRDLVQHCPVKLIHSPLTEHSQKLVGCLPCKFFHHIILHTKSFMHVRNAWPKQDAGFEAGVLNFLNRIQDHLLPEEYVHTMRDSLLDKCPVSSFAQVVQTLDEELGAPPSVLFAEFDPEPMASASLAQVRVLAMTPIILFFTKLPLEGMGTV